MKDLEIKKKLYSECVGYVEAKIESISAAVDELQKAANLETKSSMGDKYETGRASIQLEMEKYSGQLNEFMILKRILFQIDADKTYDSIQPGAVVYTNQQNYFIAINAGEVEIGGMKFFTISLASPLGKELHNRKAGEKFRFRNKEYELIKVC